MGWYTPRFGPSDPRKWGHYPRRFVWHIRQGAPENKKPIGPARPTFWRRHYEPFAKSWRGQLRQAERRFVIKQRRGVMP